MSQEPKRGHFAKKKGEIILREHEYDGIQEFDQKLPNWWLFTFYAAITFFIGYWFVYYGTTLLKSPQERVQEQVLAVQAAQLAELKKTLATLDDSRLVHEWARNATGVAAGQATFMKNCIPCHGVDLSATQDDGTGKRVALPGLPLTDHKWKFSAKPMGLFNLINKGSPPESDGNNGAKMEAWGQRLTPVQIAQLVSFIISKVPEDFQDIPAPAPAVDAE